MKIIALIYRSVQENSGVSSKRITLFSCVLVLLVITFANLFFKYQIDHVILYSIEGVIITCLTGMMVDKKSLNGQKKGNNYETERNI